MVYQEWGSPKVRRIVICVHGLTRNGRDFDYLANALSSRFRVICPDMAGRGDSDWLTHKEDYGFALYQSDATLVLARVTAPRRPLLLPWGRIRDSESVEIDWIGTSMGGLIGMMLASQPESPIRKLVLNDVGPLVPWQALLRLKGYVGRRTRFATFDEAEAYVRDVCGTFGALTDSQWRHLATHSVRHDGDGFSLAYDPAISNSASLDSTVERRSHNQGIVDHEDSKFRHRSLGKKAEQFELAPDNILGEGFHDVLIGPCLQSDNHIL